MNYIALGFLFHLIGDYLLQNDWMATNKTKNTIVALIHASLYSFLFFFITDIEWFLVLSVSHFFIDRFRLAQYWIMLVNWNWQSKNFGYDNDKPLWMSVWLMIIIDNTIHLLINSICIYYSNVI